VRRLGVRRQQKRSIRFALGLRCAWFDPRMAAQCDGSKNESAALPPALAVVSLGPKPLKSRWRLQSTLRRRGGEAGFSWHFQQAQFCRAHVGPLSTAVDRRRQAAFLCHSRYAGVLSCPSGRNLTLDTLPAWPLADPPRTCGRAGSMTGCGRKQTGGFGRSKCRSGHSRRHTVVTALDPIADLWRCLSVATTVPSAPSASVRGHSGLRQKPDKGDHGNLPLSLNSRSSCIKVSYVDIPGF
jgi:hypothetical protein